MGNMIYPKCSVPTHLLETEKCAKKCGRIDGYVTSSILSALFLCSIFAPSIVGIQKSKNTYGYSTVTTLFLFFGTGLFVGLTGLLSGWYRVMRWKGYNEQKKIYLNMGFSKKAVAILMQNERSGHKMDNLLLNDLVAAELAHSLMEK